jgi:hypothetical protein
MRGSGIPWFSVPFLVLVACSGGTAAAQDIVPGETARTVQEEEFLERVDDEDASVNVAEILSWLHENPIDLNTARQDELQSIPGITAEEAETILRARENQGEFTSVDEISSLADGDEILARIRPYVFVHIASAHDRATAHPRMIFCSRLSGFAPGIATPPGFETLGNLVKSFSRLTLKLSDHLQIGGLFEKDAGERLQDGFASGYIAFHGRGILDEVIVGDFTAEAGQGLVLWRGSDASRSGDLVRGMRKSGGRLAPYRLADEAHYLRGGAITLKSKRLPLELRWTAILSRTPLAAHVDDQGVVTSFYTSGLYRTSDELAKRSSVHETLAGTRLEAHIRGRGTVGLTCFHSSFDRAVQPGSGYGFAGEQAQVLGGDFNCAVGPATVFGELARSRGGGMAWLAGVALVADSTLCLSVVVRDYATDFLNIHARAYGVQSSSSNERGMSVGLSVRLTDGITFQGRADQCKIPSSTYVSILPRLVSDFFSQVAALLSPRLRLSVALRYRKAETMQPRSPSDTYRIQGDCGTRNIRCAASIDVSPSLRLKTRVECVESRLFVSHQVEHGSLASQTLCFHGRILRCECGGAFFDTDSYDTRLYDYEGNLSGAVTGIPLYGRGSRWHLLLSWGALSSARLTAKYAVILQERSFPVRDLTLQAEVRF